MLRHFSSQKCRTVHVNTLNAQQVWILKFKAIHKKKFPEECGSMTLDLFSRIQIRNEQVRAGIFKPSMGARNRVIVPARQATYLRLAEFILWNLFLGSINVEKYGLWIRNGAKRQRWYGRPCPWEHTDVREQGK
jgi:hypothetical protein